MQKKLTTIKETNNNYYVPQTTIGNIYQDTKNLLVSCDCQSFQIAKVCIHMGIWRKQCGMTMAELVTAMRVPRVNPFFADDVRR